MSMSYYALKGIKGILTPNIDLININKIISIQSYKRLIKLSNFDYNYSLEITYNENISCYHNQIIIRHYKTLEDIQNDIAQIERKKKLHIYWQGQPIEIPIDI